MSQPTDQENANKTSIDNNEQAELGVNPLARRPEQQITDPKNHEPEVSQYNADWLESLSFENRFFLIGLVVGVLAIFIFGSGFVTERQGEIFIASLLTLSILIAATFQAYIYKRGLSKTDNLIAQNERVINTIGDQANHMQGQLDVMKKALTHTKKQTDIAAQALEVARLSAKATQLSTQMTILTQRPEIDLRLKFGPIGTDRIVQMLFETPNVGQTTAYRFGIHICIEWKPVNYDDWLEYKEPVKTEAEPIRRNVPHFVHAAPVAPPIPTLIGMLDGSIWMIVFGVYWYYDGAGNRYEEVYCRRFNHLQTEFAVQCEGSLRAKVVKYAA